MFAPTARPWLFAWSSCSTRVLAAERGRREARDVARCEHVVATAGAAVLVDDDAVSDGQAGRSGELRRRLDPETGDDASACSTRPPPVAHLTLAPSCSMPVTVSPASTSTPFER